MSLDRIIPIISILIAALAVTFDAGYFWGLDINFFTMFSLSEHLVFAIEAIPQVLMAIIFCFLMLPILSRVIPSSEVEVAAAAGQRKWRNVFKFIGYGYFALVVVYSIWWHDYVAMTVIAYLVAAFIAVKLTSPAIVVKYPREIISCFAIVTGFIASFAIGYTNGSHYLTNAEFHPHSLQLKDSTFVYGRIVRAGDRGILFIDSKGNSLRFFRLDDIISVSRD